MLGKKSSYEFSKPKPVNTKHAKPRIRSRFADKIKPEKNPFTNTLYSNKYYRLLRQRKTLPAYQIESQFIELVKNKHIVIVQGETGSGKTTQLPQFLMNHFATQNKLIGVTQPRRVAAISVAKRVSEETDTTLGTMVGYSVRFNESLSAHTKLKYMTDGTLLRETMLDKHLIKYSVIVLDEAHERSLNSDILLAVIKRLVKTRNESPHLPDLKLVVMSATIEVERFKKYFETDVPVLTIPGRCHPVEIFYTSKPEPDYLAAAIRSAVQIHCFEPEGDILIFLTGEDEIMQAVNETRKQIEDLRNGVGPAMVLPLFSAMSAENQQRIFAPAPKGKDSLPGRKIIFSTNIAETSLTIDGVVYVVDPGLSKQKVYNPRLKIESLLVAPISKASAKQRAGRAGRTRPGKCFRLYTENSYKNDLENYTISEVLRSDLCSALMQLKSLGIDNLVNFDFIEPPSNETMSRALESLTMLGVLEDMKGGLTKLGEVMSTFPLEPKFTRVLFAAANRNCFAAALSAVSVISSGNWRVRDRSNNFQSDMVHRKYVDPRGCDLTTVVNVFEAFEKARNKFRYCKENYLNYRTLSAAVNVRNQLYRIAQKCAAKGFLIDLQDQPVDAYTRSISLRKSFIEGFYQNVAFLQKSGRYQVLRENHLVLVHPSSALKSKKEFVLYLEFVQIGRAHV